MDDSLLPGLLDELDAYADSVREETAIVQELEEERRSASPGSIMMQTVEDVLLDPDFMAMAITMITDDQMWDRQINMYGMKLPRYKPSTLRKKVKLGHPPDKLVNYTNYWTGRMRNEAVKVAVDVSSDSYDFRVFDVPGKMYSQFIPPDRIGLTDENREVFEYWVRQEVQERLDMWMADQLRMNGIDPVRYGYIGV